MSRHTRSKRNRQSRNAKARRRRVVGWGTSAGAVLAFGLGPLGVAPAAHADEFEVILDPIINSLSSVDPMLGHRRRRHRRHRFPLVLTASHNQT